MHIIVLGNGFDLAHGLPTRYTDFLKYCRDYSGKDNPISDSKEAESEFAENIKENVWLKYFLEITTNFIDNRTWIDFEIEILNVIQSICPSEWLRERKSNFVTSIGNTVTVDEFGKSKYAMFSDFVNFDAFLSGKAEFPQHEAERLYSELRKFTRAFEIYCCSKINEKCGIKKRYKLNEALLSIPHSTNSKQETFIVSFNYTRTFNRFYDTDERKSNNDYSYVYPHGEACTDVTLESAYDGLVTSGLVLGTQSFDHEDRDYDIPVAFNMFQKHNQQHRYSTLADFQSLLLKLRESSESGDSKQVNIFVIGHSLDKSDHTKLKHLFTENKNAKITIFYHDEESFQRYINNITEILGESDVAVRVRFYHQNNQPNGLLLPYWCFDDGRISYSIIDLADDQISEILTDYFISNKIPDILDELSTHKSSRLRPNPSIVLNLLMRKILQSMVQDISKLNCKLVLIAI